MSGTSYPLGATCDPGGINFAVFSETATRIEVCLFDAIDAPPWATLALPERTGHVHHGYVPGLRAGQLYGLRAHGRYEPAAGLRHNAALVLVDPYARAIVGPEPGYVPYAYRTDAPGADLVMDPTDNAARALKSVALGDAFEWGDDRRPGHAWGDTLIYELHVKGMTKLHPGVPEALRGTYAGLATPAVVEHLRSLGVTAVELLPVHEIFDEPHLRRLGLTNYWGYSTLGFFAPTRRYAAGREPGAAVREFKEMVRGLHAAGIEVILDVVYNHTCEGGPLGPTLSLRGLDNRSYYAPRPGDARQYLDVTGCGHTLQVAHPQALQLVMDSLRYWVTHMRVDGFRFDLASALARRGAEFDRWAAFLAAVQQDPVLRSVKLIAEPWDVGPGGYQVGGFPSPWAEWNGRYRDAMRRFWRGDLGLAAELGFRLTGSADLYAGAGRGPHASVNYVACHDGFPLRDLTMYARKHNLANGEDNRDGSDHEHSANWGVEGPSRDPEIAELRARVVRNLAASLALSVGVPMICAGDEIGRTQGGNNNAYCQDNQVSWIDWERGDAATLAFFRHVFKNLRHSPTLRRRGFFTGARIGTHKDLQWLRPDGAEPSPRDWNDPRTQALGLLLGGETGLRDAQGRALVGETLLVLINASAAAVRFVLPALAGGWARLVDTRHADTQVVPLAAEQRDYELVARSLVVLWLTAPRAAL
ncbi:MAG: glycogen debranching protein GlgX [Myxococcales bacterium]|nr:glycogen debranching protein GlgX [Myxococcales bacterium]